MVDEPERGSALVKGFEPEAVQQLVQRELENYKALVLAEVRLERRKSLAAEKRTLLSRVADIERELGESPKRRHSEECERCRRCAARQVS